MNWLRAAVTIANSGAVALAAGEMYDLMKKRDTALEKYKAVIAENWLPTPPIWLATT